MFLMNRLKVLLLKSKYIKDIIRDFIISREMLFLGIEKGMLLRSTLQGIVHFY